MKVGFGVSVLSRGFHSGGIDGIGTYTHELARALVPLTDIELEPVSFGQAVETGIPSLTTGQRLPPYPLMAASSACLHTPFRGHSQLKNRLDLFHATDHLIPCLPKLPVVATLMDAIPLSRPEWIRTHHLQLKCWLWRRAATWANHVITISAFSKSEIVHHFGIAAEKVSVIPLGVDPRFFERIDDAAKESIMENLRLPPQFFLSIGTLQPRKNIERILQAHASMPLTMQKAIPLVIVGQAGWGVDHLLEMLAAGETKGTVRWLKYLPDLQVRALMQSASALVFPSLCEGFGLPVVEAFASRLPVITSNTTSLPEVASDAALLVNPVDVDDIAYAMQQIINDQVLATQLLAKGLARAKVLSWASCAQQTVALYKRMASHC